MQPHFPRISSLMCWKEWKKEYVDESNRNKREGAMRWSRHEQGRFSLRPH